jgi:hypothetical protein
LFDFLRKQGFICNNTLKGGRETGAVARGGSNYRDSEQHSLCDITPMIRSSADAVRGRAGMRGCDLAEPSIDMRLGVSQT